MPDSAFDPQLSAELHNTILHHAWTGAGRDLALLPSTTWWEGSSPLPADTAIRLNANLVHFLRLAKITTPDPQFHFFYFLRSLQVSAQMYSLSYESDPDRFIYLYPSTSAIFDEDEVGIVFDQKTELAAYVAHWYDIPCMFGETWGWKPLQDILRAYLEMIEEGKVQASSNRVEEEEEEQEKPRFFPWQYHEYTDRDIAKAINAFTRLLDAIDQRLPQPARDPELQLPYSPATLAEAAIPINTFIRSFLSEVPPRTLSFRYIAPGISIQSATEFIARPWKDLSYIGPFLLFRGDESSSLSYKRLLFPNPEYSHQGVSTGLYLMPAAEGPANFRNSCRLLLPFNIGAREYARFSNGQKLQEARAWYMPQEDTSFELYQPGRESGFLEFHEVQLHKVLLNWAERVEMGDWEVNADGVVGGIRKFAEADTPEHWKEYQIPLSW
ncbi:uncharacterized protein N7482_007691 [Penicillium canariense]|uniref:Uncharacterized protein n=1 Tax=Penicillium canariense TaxID=189055 RepID=A0A9W9HX90_9EURO|nr:uncharacterized protein N7482_007691 [Penicillium canariense]KAJ5160687.1 hypothetical protein N7482_007691 [Penicillium canariense]